MLKTKQKILVGMSGGVDSAVAAALLKQQGFDVTGVFMINWHEKNELVSTGTCTWEQDQADARRVAEILGIKIYTWDFSAAYQKYVFSYFLQAYEQGLTPNPDTLCNKYIKFGLFLEQAKQLGFDKIATGHYAKVIKKNDYKLITAKDKNKDQTYFLYELGQKELAQVLFPLAGLKKEKVRHLARTLNLPVCYKKDSYGICYIGEKKMKDFLTPFIKKNPGDIVNEDGHVLGQHAGLFNYTLGQRQGIGIGGGQGPFFVLKKDLSNNRLIVTNNTQHSDFYTCHVKLKQINWLSGFQPTLPINCWGRFRHLQKLLPLTIQDTQNTELLVKFKQPQRAVAKGQVLVFYKSLNLWHKNYEVLGGGIIA
ncbi:MAG TPA: tRNA 2-thiouridine(34) synthase MnmA [bacterium]|nr:tRNA 2-thiouridine(34) synthase MnmA [bacterium]